jgi:hypothetical protein
MCCRVALSFVGDGRGLGGFLPLADEGGKVEGRGWLAAEAGGFDFTNLLSERGLILVKMLRCVALYFPFFKSPIASTILSPDSVAMFKFLRSESICSRVLASVSGPSEVSLIPKMTC